MPRGGWRPGSGRKPKHPDNITKDDAARIADRAKRSGKMLAIQVLSNSMNTFYDLADKHRPTADNDAANRNEVLFKDYMARAVKSAEALAPYQTPRLAPLNGFDRTPDPGGSSTETMGQATTPQEAAKIYQDMMGRNGEDG